MLAMLPEGFPFSSVEIKPDDNCVINDVLYHSHATCHPGGDGVWSGPVYRGEPFWVWPQLPYTETCRTRYTGNITIIRNIHSPLCVNFINTNTLITNWYCITLLLFYKLSLFAKVLILQLFCGLANHLQKFVYIIIQIATILWQRQIPTYWTRHVCVQGSYRSFKVLEFYFFLEKSLNLIFPGKTPKKVLEFGIVSWNFKNLSLKIQKCSEILI